jgi:YHS domain-containing protein
MDSGKTCKKVIMATCTTVLIMSGIFAGEQVKNGSSSAKPEIAKTVKQMKTQTTCPVTGEPINKSLFVDYNGKRIYVCCADCIDKVKKDPEKYIKKLESLGQSVEEIGDKTAKENQRVNTDTTMGMHMKGMKMPGDKAVKTADTGYWTCSMHPEIHQTTSGKCPVCGMNLVFKKSNTTPTEKGMAAPVTKNLKPQTICPVMGGEIDKNIYLDFEGKRIYFCCDGCKGTFKKDPEKYLKKIRDAGEEPEALKK